MDCTTTRAARFLEWTWLNDESLKVLSDLVTVTGQVNANKAVFCDPASSLYNPVCCSTYSAKVTGLPTGLSDRRDQLAQFAHDAIDAIDCTRSDWQTLVPEADARLQDLIDFDRDNRRLRAELLSWLDSMALSCPLTTPGGG